MTTLLLKGHTACGVLGVMNTLLNNINMLVKEDRSLVLNRTMHCGKIWVALLNVLSSANIDQ